MFLERKFQRANVVRHDPNRRAGAGSPVSFRWQIIDERPRPGREQLEREYAIRLLVWARIN
jgi:hypothetical protein